MPEDTIDKIIDEIVGTPDDQYPLTRKEMRQRIRAICWKAILMTFERARSRSYEEDMTFKSREEEADLILSQL